MGICAKLELLREQGGVAKMGVWEYQEAGGGARRKERGW